MREPMYVDITMTHGDRVYIHNLVIDPDDGGEVTISTDNEFTETRPCEENDWRPTIENELTGRVNLTLELTKARYREAEAETA